MILEQHVMDQLDRYLREPTAAHFLQLREAVAYSPQYAPYSNYRTGLNPLLEAGRYQEALQQLQELIPNWLLNPGFHLLNSFVFHKLGRKDMAQSELWMREMTIRGILSTGDGSKDRPYLVLHTADEYDLLQHLGKEPARQSLVEHAGRKLDCQDCRDGSEIWFDVTLLLRYLGGQLGHSET